MTVKLELTNEEAEWLDACLGLVMKLARAWDNRTATDISGRTWAKLNLARAVGDIGVDPDEWLDRRVRIQASIDASEQVRPVGDQPQKNQHDGDAAQEQAH